MLCALERGKPDRLPVSVHQWQSYHLNKYLNGISELEAFERFGMDAQIQYIQDMGQVGQAEAGFTNFSVTQWNEQAQIISDDPDNRIIHYNIRTPEGTLAYKMAGNRMTTWITESLIKHDEDIELIRKYMPVPNFDSEPVSKLYEEIGDRGILRGFIWGNQAGCWQHACCLMDASEMILKCIDKPDWVHEFLGILLEKKMKFIASLKGAKFDLIETGGGAASSTVISPKLHEEFCLPYDRKMHDALHDLGFKVSYHICGGTLGIEEHIIANGCDTSETLAPPSVGGNQEPQDFKAKVRDQISLIGGLDQFSILTDGTESQIRDKVFELFEKVGDDGGYICSLSDHFFETPLEKLEIFSKAARECVY